MNMKKLLDSIIKSLEADRPVVLVSIVANSGSTPRGAGAMMAVFPGGGSAGTIGGGAVEYEAQKQAVMILESKQTRINPHTLTKYDVADLGMICGGDVTVFYEYLDPADNRALELFTYIRASLDKNENAWLIRRFEDGTPVETAVFDGGGLHFTALIKEDEVSPLLGTSASITGEKIRIYTEPLVRAGKVYIFGGGHVAQELAPALSRVGFSVTVIDDREGFTNPELFPGADDIKLCEFTEISDKLSVGEPDYAVVVTRGHQYDYEVLEQLLKTQARYIGCIGSAKKMDTIRRRLIGAGIPEDALKRLFSPIGLKIKADTPAEIAISIAAEMILFRAENH